MDTNALKKFAQAARNLLIDQVTSKLDLVLDPASPVQREHPTAMKALNAAIARDGKRQVIEQVAYTWFNRFTALRFMDVNGYTTVGVVSPTGDQTRPELLAEAMAGNLPEGAPATIAALLDGRTPSSDPQAEAYRQLLVHTCNQWHGPMPFLFEEIDDYTELLMPEDLLSQTSILARLRDVMTEDACQDVEIIGWLYQFYISEKKDQVFAGLKKNQKITAENIPAATQLFTPHWIVRYLVENSLGRLWLLNRPGSKLAEKMDYYIAPEEPEKDFLKIGKPEEIRVCDPACGSGHMLTYAFDLLYAIYEEEGYEADKIPALILANNLTGVEIDDRAGALAAFALAMKAAARLGRRRFLRMEAKPDICVLQNVRFKDDEIPTYISKIGRDLFTDGLIETMKQFDQSKNFGSLIVPKLKSVDEVRKRIAGTDLQGNLFIRDVHERVQKVLAMAEALSPRYQVVVANPPYMGSGGMNANLKTWLTDEYPVSKADLMTAFMERAIALTVHGGAMSMINLPSWMFISSFEKLRVAFLDRARLTSMLHCGRGLFGSDFGAVAFATVNTATEKDRKGVFRRLFTKHVEVRKPEVIQQLFLDKQFQRYAASNEDFAKIPGRPIAYWVPESIRALFLERPVREVFDLEFGIKTGDNEAYLRFWHEVAEQDTNIKTATRPKFIKHNKGGEYRKWYGNGQHLVDWQHPGELMNVGAGTLPSSYTSFRAGAVTWSEVTSGSFCTRFLEGAILSNNKGPAASSEKREELAPLLGLTNTKLYNYLTQIINPTVTFPIGDFGKLPFPPTFAGKSRISQNAMELVQYAKSDWDAYETSWDFAALPLLSLSYRAEALADGYDNLRAHWQAMTDQMKRLEEENNRIFIDAYGLQDELTPEVPLREITLTCNPAYSIGTGKTDGDREDALRARTMTEFLSYAVGCMFGRYSLDAPGLILANQGERLEDYLARIPEPSFMPDADNVIPVLDENWFADDITERFRLFLRVTFGEAHFRENLRYIEDALGKDIRKYFTKDFYADHVKRYKKRPIYWMFSSPKGTFNALIYMHRYRGDTVSVLLNDYLREFISKLEGERGRLEKLSDDPSASQGQRTKALKDMAVIAKQIDELNEWERDVVFPLAQAKIEIDLDDGVKANYPKFGAALKKIPGLEAKDD